MEEDDDLIPLRPVGRPMRRFNGDALSDTRSAQKCRGCTKYDRKRVWCPLKACCRPPDASACQYGLTLMNAVKLKERRTGDA